jgi:6-pyruvoyltetrahydropterin/6-carboxytetrahydropterin synthase
MATGEGRIRISKRFTFEMAHALEGHDGLCAHIHGHSYKMIVTLEGAPRVEPGHPKDGMIMDYSDLKRMVKEKILDEFDHALVLKETHRWEGSNTRVVRTPYQPTCENLLLDFVARLKDALPESTRLASLELWETEDNSALWVA